MSIRPIKRVVEAQPTIEGAGVQLRRAFGFGQTDDFDPFHANCYENNDPADASFFALWYFILATDPMLPDPPPLPWQPPTCD